MNAGPVTVMIAWNHDWLTALDQALPAESVIVLEELDLYVGKRMAARWDGHPVMREARFTEYQQADRYLEDIGAIAHDGPIRAILPGSEYAVEAVACAADQLGLPGAGPGAAAALRDKIRLRQACAQAGLATPRFAELTSAADLAAFAAGGPCVVKPANRQASLGVLRLEPGDDIAAAWQECVTADEGVQMARRPMRWRYIAEDWLRGQEYSVEALVADGEVLFVNITLKRVNSGRHPVECGHLVPAPPGLDVDMLRSAMPSLIQAVGFRTGVLHAEWIIDNGQPVLVECAGRPAGDWIFDLIKLTQCVDLYQAAERVLADEPAGLVNAAGPAAAAAVSFLLPDFAGTVSDVAGTDKAAAVPGVHRVSLMRSPGDIITAADCSWSRLAAVIATGGTAAEAETAAEEGLALITVAISPKREQDPTET